MTPGHEEIAAIADPALRNLWITQRYHELALGLRGCGAYGDATWCAFAVWASKTAGSVIRGDDLPSIIRRLTEREAAAHVDRFNREAAAHRLLEELLGMDHLVGFTDRVCAVVSGHIADGNLLVFRELAGPFEALLEGWPAGPAVAVKAALAALPPSDVSDELRQVFESYGRALDCGAPEQSARILAANVLAVAHEQRRLQPAITASLDAAVQEGLVRHLEGGILRHLAEPARRLLDGVVGDLAAVLDRVCETVLTGVMLSLVTADEHLDLGRDLPALSGVMWPPELVDPGDAAPVLALWDRTGGTGRPTAARDWSCLEERMNYIVNLFRSRQRHAAMFDPPFTGGQLAQMRAGRLPDGPL